MRIKTSINVETKKWDKFVEICRKRNIPASKAVRKMIREFNKKEKDK